MSKYRFEVGTAVMCNFGQHGWKLGKIIALDYREPSWPEEKIAPYQVALEEDYTLIYVPKDNDSFCRKATDADVNMLVRNDALAKLNDSTTSVNQSGQSSIENSNLCCSNDSVALQFQSYRKGRCFCCNDCPKNWLYAELYSEHYQCAAKNNVKVTHHEIDLGSFKVGESVEYNQDEFLQGITGFLQAPTLARLPPGVIFSDDGTLSGKVRFDPYRDMNYDVDFVAVSTAKWDDLSVGLIRLSISFKIEGNDTPSDFDLVAFQDKQSKDRAIAVKIIENLNKTWSDWESRKLINRATCDIMLEDLHKLRDLLDSNPRLDNGKWWGHLGGYHMNVHKLLENALFECELYLGYALTFGDDDVRFYAEQNLKGCYQKRLLEAARFMWYDGIELMLQNEWTAAIEVFRAAYDKKEGWGWAVNYGDIWLSEAVALIINGVSSGVKTTNVEDLEWFKVASELVARAQLRSKESGVFGPEGHPWISEINIALESCKDLISNGKDTTAWLEEINTRTVYWCSQVLAGIFPFPPKARARLASESTLIDNLPAQA